MATELYCFTKWCRSTTLLRTHWLLMQQLWSYVAEFCTVLTRNSNEIYKVKILNISWYFHKGHSLTPMPRHTVGSHSVLHGVHHSLRSNVEVCRRTMRYGHHCSSFGECGIKTSQLLLYKTNLGPNRPNGQSIMGIWFHLHMDQSWC